MREDPQATSFALELLEEHRGGKSVEELSREMGIPAERIEMRLRAAAAFLKRTSEGGRISAERELGLVTWVRETSPQGPRAEKNEDSANPKSVDLRKHGRVPVKTYADLRWEGADGQMKFARARVLDISEGGVGLSLPGCSFNIGASVHLRIEQFGFAEYGMVHHTRGDGILGIKLRFEAATQQELERWKKCVQSAQST